ncbi:unnamed protein product [Parajaminaea phylloscopi]
MLWTAARMAWTCSGRTNAELIANLKREGLISSQRVADAMTAVDRRCYCRSQSDAYQDSPQLIGHGATITAPHMHANAVEAVLDFLRPGASVLDIGSGSGYLTAVFHHLVKSATDGEARSDESASPGRVVGIEHMQQLSDWSIENLERDGLGPAMQQGHIEMVVGDGRQGWPLRAPYDVIHVGAASPPSVLETLEAQLASPGRLFIPVEDPATREQDIYQVDRDAAGNIKREKLYAVRYVPLTSVDKQQRSSLR